MKTNLTLVMFMLTFVYIHAQVPTTSTQSTLIVMDYQDFGKLVRSTGASENTLLQNAKKSEESHGQSDLSTIRYQEEMAKIVDRQSDPTVRYTKLIRLCLSSDKILLKQPWDGNAKITTIPPLNELADIIIISPDGKSIRVGIIKPEDVAMGDFDFSKLLTDAPDIVAVETFVKTSYNQ